MTATLEIPEHVFELYYESDEMLDYQYAHINEMLYYDIEIELHFLRRLPMTFPTAYKIGVCETELKLRDEGMQDEPSTRETEEGWQRMTEAYANYVDAPWATTESYPGMPTIKPKHAIEW